MPGEGRSPLTAAGASGLLAPDSTVSLEQEGQVPMTHLIARRPLQGLALVAMLLALPALASAQEATLTGTIRDSSGGVLPGVTVTALHEATGNTFLAVTDDVGGFRLLLRTGGFRITAELPG